MTLRVLHVTPTYRPAVGGIETVIENLCRCLLERGVTSDIAHVAPGLKPAVEEVRGIRVERVPLKGHFYAGLAPGLEAAARGYDLLHVHDPQLLSLSASLILYCRGQPAVLSTHGGFFHTTKHRLAKSVHASLLAPQVLKRYALVLASSRADLDRFRKFAPRTVLAENGVDVARFSSIESRADRSPFNWLYWGRLSTNKRLDLVLDLAQTARSLGYPVTLTITGADFDGTGPGLRRRIDAEGLGFVTLLDGTSEAELSALVGSAGLYITASEHEGFGLTVIEAMAAGLPVICRDKPPLSGFVDKSCGLLLAFDGSRKDLGQVDAFLSALPSRMAELSERARAVAGRYAWEARIDDFLEHYRCALGCESGPAGSAGLERAAARTG